MRGIIIFLALSLAVSSPALAATYTHTSCVTNNSKDCSEPTIFQTSKDYSDPDDAKAKDACDKAALDKSQISCHTKNGKYECIGLEFDDIKHDNVISDKPIFMHTSCAKTTIF